MNAPSLPHAGPLAIDLNQPGTYLHWSIFTVSGANLALIACDGRDLRRSPAAAVPKRPR